MLIKEDIEFVDEDFVIVNCAGSPRDVVEALVALADSLHDDLELWLQEQEYEREIIEEQDEVMEYEEAQEEYCYGY